MMSVIFMAGVMGVFIFHAFASEAPPSQLSSKDYSNGRLREKDAIKRNSPHLKKQLAKKGLTLGAPIFIRIFKESKTLEIWVKQTNQPTYKLFKSWPIAAMSGTLGPKTKEGDRQAPEGFYYVSRRQMKPDSKYHLAFNIGYPNTYDLTQASTGSFIMVHGNCVSIGCFAMTDPGIEEIYTLCALALKNGQPFFRVHIFPFPMSDERLSLEKNSPHFAFWKNLQSGYTYFETHHRPPNVTVKNKIYCFE